jgi:hypothetical protein
MRFIVFVKATQESEAGVMPGPEMLRKMGAFNQELVKAGAMLDGGGLTPTSKGSRITWAGGKPTVTDGPFTETKELVAGYWMLQMRSKEEAIEWLRRAPFDDAQIEIRRLFEMEDYDPAAAEANPK